MAARITAYLVALIVATTIIAGLLVGAQRDTDGPVDLIVVNGRVYTGNDDAPVAEAVAVQGNKILQVGTTREIQRLRRPQTLVIDADGGSVLPGFNDAHAHLLSGGLSLDQVNLLDARTLADVERTVRRWAAANPDREWVRGRGWLYEPFPGGLPTRQLLDQLVPDRPAYLTSYDGHTGWANSRALRLAHITKQTPPPANGMIVKDSRTGEPTGVLKESAMQLMAPLLPRPTHDEQVAALRAAMTEAHRRGITSVQNAGISADELALYEHLRRERALEIRVYAAITVSPDITSAELDALDTLLEQYSDDPLFKSGAAKIMADGVIETYTAALLAPYTTRPQTRGEPRMSQTTLDTLVADLDRRGWQVMVHAIGDRTIRMALDAFEEAAARNPEPERGRRHRVEHIETVDPSDIPRFAQLGVAASMQPYHGDPDPGQMSVWLANVGPERAARAWASASIARSGGRLAFGSDWPVASMDPLLGLHVAVNRTSLDGKPDGGWTPSERLSLFQAVNAYTRDAAWASFDEHRKGVIERDMLADLVVLSKDIFALPPARLTDAVVAVTIFDGRVVYQRSSPTDD
jgi:predicted amidohydrolase YtcJ